MSTYTVHFTQTISIAVKVELADDTAMPDGELDVDAVEEAADQEAPSGVCAHCSGWGQSWARDDSGERMLQAIEKDGAEVWNDDPQVNALRTASETED